MTWTTLKMQDFGTVAAASVEVDVTGYSDAQVFLTKVNNVGNDEIEVHVSNDGTNYETSNIWRWIGSGRTVQSVIPLRRAYSGVSVARCFIENLNDADAGIHWYTWEGDFAQSETYWGGQATPSAIQKIKIATQGGSDMNQGHLKVRAR